MTNFRDGLTGRYTTKEDAEARPAETVAETTPPPVDLEAAAERIYAALVPDAAPWGELPQHLRDNYRAAARAAHDL